MPYAKGNFLIRLVMRALPQEAQKGIYGTWRAIVFPIACLGSIDADESAARRWNTCVNPCILGRHKPTASIKGATNCAKRETLLNGEWSGDVSKCSFCWQGAHGCCCKVTIVADDLAAMLLDALECLVVPATTLVISFIVCTAASLHALCLPCTAYACGMRLAFCG